MVDELIDTSARSSAVDEQHGFAYRFDWGPDGLRNLAPVATVVVIVDVMMFTSAVSAAIESGARVLLSRSADDSVPLSLTDLLTLSPSARVVLPSSEGAALGFAARRFGASHVLAGCLRNATATARAAVRLAGGGAIAVVATGERWHGTTGPLRPAVEDLLGAGAVLAALDPAAAASAPCCSPEAAAARAAFVAARPRLHDALASCGSGRGFLATGYEDDVANCAALDVTDLVPHLDGESFVALPAPPTAV